MTEINTNSMLITDDELEGELFVLEKIADAEELPRDEIQKKFMNLVARCDPDSGKQMYTVMVAFCEPAILRLIASVGDITPVTLLRSIALLLGQQF
jgi:hypothetical protein